MNFSVADVHAMSGGYPPRLQEQGTGPHACCWHRSKIRTRTGGAAINKINGFAKIRCGRGEGPSSDGTGFRGEISAQKAA
jgi:hypothetical protein